MNILVVGDVVGAKGCEILRKQLPKIKKEYNIDLCIVNGENSAEGNGITPHSMESIFVSGADVITGGNHTLRRKEIYEELENNPFMLRPHNFPDNAPGTGVTTVDLGHTTVGIINMLGTVYMESMNSPYEYLDKAIKHLNGSGVKTIIVDFHCEATSEKRAIGFYLDSRVTAVVGTHTHVQTADAQVLNGGTAYITDVGMTGAKNSVLGVKTDIVISKLKDKLPVRFVNEQEGPLMLNAVVITAENGKATACKAINIEEG